MSFNLDRAKVEVLGEVFYVKADPRNEAIGKTSDFLVSQINDLESRYPSLSAKRLAILAAFNMADELLRLREDYEQIVTILDR